MKLLSAVLLTFLLINCSTRQDQKFLVNGITNDVEVIRDSVGVNHIYASNEHDLFFAQGYCAARDRLFQFELWRRQATGTVAEILGEKEVKRDIGARLFKYRGDLETEFNHYHKNGSAIIKAYTDGVNAYIDFVLKDTTMLPLEFKLLGIKPKRWHPEDVISRHQGLLGNLTDEINIARAVAAMGEDQVKFLYKFEPENPNLTIDPAIDKAMLSEDIIELYNAFRKPLTFSPGDLKAEFNSEKEHEQLARLEEEELMNFLNREPKSIGSNNWIIGKDKSESGFPMLANDPHRTIVAPSLRYMVHLNAPGWNVLGGGEPTIPGVSIGHNDVGAWGLTVFNIDAEDLYVYQLNPANAWQYLYKGQWETMKVIPDTIIVKGGKNVLVKHLYTRHGPVTFVDSVKHVAYAVKCGWLEPGGSPYLASLRMDQSGSWEEFREACSYSHIPGENMIWADKNGNTGWQAVGVAPIRNGWSGLVPVPGDGRYEWDGYLPIKELPNLTNPEAGFYATANEHNVPADYPHQNAVGLQWADKFRVLRINEVLGARVKIAMDDMMKLQCDYLSIPARDLIALLKNISIQDPEIESLADELSTWDYVLNANSTVASIYVEWEKALNSNVRESLVPASGRSYIRNISTSKMIELLKTGSNRLGGRAGCDALMIESLKDAFRNLNAKLGTDQSKWQYGQAANHHVLIRHPLSNAVNDSLRSVLNAGPLPRGGYSSTPGMTTSNDNQTAGASFKMVIDTKDWNAAKFTNTPGQSGNPESRFYKNLFTDWANNKYFTVYFSKEKIVNAAAEKIELTARK